MEYDDSTQRLYLSTHAHAHVPASPIIYGSFNKPSQTAKSGAASIKI